MYGCVLISAVTFMKKNVAHCTNINGVCVVYTEYMIVVSTFSCVSLSPDNIWDSTYSHNQSHSSSQISGHTSTV